MAKKKNTKENGSKSLRSKEQFTAAILQETTKCEQCYLWLEEHMPPHFFEDLLSDDLLLVAHNLMGFHLQDYFAHTLLKDYAIVLCLDDEDADIRILKNYQSHGIRNYQAFVSNSPPPYGKVKSHVRIAIIHFTTAPEARPSEQSLDAKITNEIRELVKVRNPEVTDGEFHQLIEGLGSRFLRGITGERLILALDMFFRAKTRDHCQYEVHYNEQWQEGKDTPSMQLVFAWKNVPKHGFLYALARVIHRHGLSMRRVTATYIDPYSKDSVLIMSIGLHGKNGKAAWEATNVADLLQEIVTLKFFQGQEIFQTTFVDTGLVTGNMGNLLKTLSYFVHQTLTYADPNMYRLSNIEEGLCRLPELTLMLAEAFTHKFHPTKCNLQKYEKVKKEFLDRVADLDTGNQTIDTQRKNILYQGMNFIEHTLKTNFYRNNKTAFSFRLDPNYLDHLPYDRRDKFPELPYGIFFIRGLYYIGFHIRFKDLSRGGLRTVSPKREEQMLWERNQVFAECYNLAYTQQKKNKDIPEGGAKAIIFLELSKQLEFEMAIYKEELELAEEAPEKIEKKLMFYQQEHQLEHLYQSQRSFIEAFVSILNCDPDGKLRTKNIVDYWKRPEYIYLGPDENLHNAMIEWIAAYAKHYNYKPQGSFISSKPSAGINHKEYGVTSLGVNVYMEEMVKYLGINPKSDPFTIKMSGGPDGDVAGNQILNLFHYFPKTAKLLALTDVSGTIYDPKGLNLKTLVDMFHKSLPICLYPPDQLNDEGFLLDLGTKREQTAYAQQTLCWEKKKGKLTKVWLSGNEMNHLFRHNVHQTKTDIFIPGGGRPRTLNEENYKDFLDETGKPTSHAIIEGANLYLTPGARRALEKLGVLIIKDSSANKGGVICSSFEVLTNLVLSEREFIENKPTLMPEILGAIRDRAQDEAELLLETHAKTGAYLTDLSEQVSEKINTYMYQLLDYFEGISLSDNPDDPLIQCLIRYCPPFLRKRDQQQIIKNIPDIHKKAIIATYIAANLVYKRGLSWSPSIIDVLPLVVADLEKDKKKPTLQS